MKYLISKTVKALSSYEGELKEAQVNGKYYGLIENNWVGYKAVKDYIEATYDENGEELNSYQDAEFNFSPEGVKLDLGFISGGDVKLSGKLNGVSIHDPRNYDVEYIGFSEGELDLPVAFTIPSGIIRKTSGEGLDQAIALVEDLTLFGNGEIKPSENGELVTISMSRDFYASLNDERKSEIAQIVSSIN